MTEQMTEQIPDNEPVESLMEHLGDKDGMVRKRARASLVARGAPAVAPLSLAVCQSRQKQVRWEAAKALGELCAVEAIPSLVLALDDSDDDVSWLAAEALEKLGQAAWPALLNALVERGAENLELRQGAHHALKGQRQAGLNDALKALQQALESNVGTDTPPAAANLLKRMRQRSRR